MQETILKIGRQYPLHPVLLYIFKNDSILKKVRLLEPDKRSEYISLQSNIKMGLN